MDGASSNLMPSTLIVLPLLKPIVLTPLTCQPASSTIAPPLASPLSNVNSIGYMIEVAM
jgi:hypothetical protein